ncbi:MAG: fibronectin type III domain-containing protein, partial [bacterium]
DPKYTTLPNPLGPPDNVTDLALTEMTNAPGFWISFNIPQNDIRFHHADVQISLNNTSGWWTIRANVTRNSNIEVKDLLPGQTYYVRVISYNNAGHFNLTPVTDSILVTWQAFQPPEINGLRLDGERSLNTTVFTKRDAKFTWRETSVTSGAGHLPAGQEPLGAGQSIDDANFRYWVEIHKNGIMKRKEIVADNHYIYSYEKNVADNGSAVSTFTIKVWGFNVAANLKSVRPATLRVSNPAPAAVSGLTASQWMEGIKFSWQRSPEIDFDYFSYRIQVESDGWSDWSNVTGCEVFRFLTAAEVTAHGSEANIQIEIKVYDTFGNASTTSTTNADCLGLNIQAADIDSFAIDASKIFTKIPIITGDTWTDNSPGAGSIAFNEHTLYYNGVAYTIAAGNTDLKYIYWVNGASAYSYSNSNPTLTDGDFIIAVNISGSHDLAWNAIANQVIGSAYIENLAVQNQHVNDLSADKITAGTLSGILITGNTIQTSTSGRKIIITSDGMTLHTGAVTGKYSTFKYGDGTKYGSGALAYIHHVAETVPFYISAEQTVGDFHHYNRSSDPSGAAEVGDVCCVNGIIKRCTSAGTPGTWLSNASLV